MKTRNKILSRSLIVGALVLAQSAAQAGPYWGHHHHHHHHGGGISVGAAVLGLAVAVPLIAMAARAERQSEVVYQPVYQPVPVPPPVIVQRQIEYVPAPQPAPLPSRFDPIIYPRNGQGAQQLEFDRQDCNRWATTQPAAMQDGSVYNRAVEACMDGRGYTMR